MIEIKQHENYSENKDRFPCKGDEYPCIFCGKAVKNPIYFVHVGLGGLTIVSDEEHDALEATGKYGGDLGFYPVGPDCWKMHPEARPYRDGAGPKLEKELAEKMVNE